MNEKAETILHEMLDPLFESAGGCVPVEDIVAALEAAGLLLPEGEGGLRHMATEKPQRVYTQRRNVRQGCLLGRMMVEDSPGRCSGRWYVACVIKVKDNRYANPICYYYNGDHAGTCPLDKNDIVFRRITRHG